MFQGIDPLKPIIVTSSGRFLDVRDPDMDMVLIEDIAKALSKICRWGGHPKHHYSVAQHSVLVSSLVEPHLALDGLLHDAAEAYLGDMPRPIKMLFPEFKLLENNLLCKILNKFGVYAVQDTGGDVHYAGMQEVKKWDDFMLRLEYEELFPKDPNWTKLRRVEPGRMKLKNLLVSLRREKSVAQIETLFLSHFNSLTRNGG